MKLISRISFKGKEVLCKNCGFFCWQFQNITGEGPYTYEEFPKVLRDDFENKKFTGSGEDPGNWESYEIHCLRSQWRWAPGTKAKRFEVDLNEVKKPRKCVYYIEYQPGFGPEEHKELKREADTNRIIRNATIIGAIIGAIAAISAQVLYVIITKLIGF